MPRISLTDDVPADLAELFSAATNGRRPPLNLHRQMASAPVVLAAYVGIRRAIEAHGTLELRTRFALMLAVSAATGCEYTQAVNRVLTARAGMPPEQIDAVLAGEPTGDAPLDALLAVAREAASDDGRVTGAAWAAATAAGVTDAQLAEAYASIGLAVYVDQFVNYADTPFDMVPLRRQVAIPHIWAARDEGGALREPHVAEAGAMLDDLVWWATTLRAARTPAAVA